MSNDIDYTSAVSRLEEIQKKFYENAGIEPEAENASQKAFDAEFLRETFEKLGLGMSGTVEEWEKRISSRRDEAASSAPTKYQNHSWYMVLLSLVADIQKSMEGRQFSSSKKPIFGTVPSGRLNGVAIGIDNPSHHLILLEDGVFPFANLLCKVVGQAMLMEESDKEGFLSFSVDIKKIRDAVANDRTHAARLLDLLTAYTVLGHPHRAEPYLPLQSHLPIVDLMRSGMELFIVGHEYGHCIAGHLDGQAKQSLPELELSDEEIEEIVTNWTQETEADYYGCILTLDAVMREGFDPAMSFMGITAFFGGAYVIENFTSILSTGELSQKISASHPPPMLRLHNLLEAVKRGNGEEAALGLVQLAENVWAIIDVLWEQILPVAQDMHRDGVRPKGHWSV